MTAGTLIVLGTDDGAAEPAAGAPLAADLLAGADGVFAGPPGGDDPEAIALFYAEAWRVERVSPFEAAARLDAWFGERAGRTGVLVVAGPVDAATGLAAAVDGLMRLRPGLRVDRCRTAVVSPPRRNPLVG